MNPFAVNRAHGAGKIRAMHSEPFYVLVHLALAAFYVLLAWWSWSALEPGTATAMRERGGLAAAIAVHGALLGSSMLAGPELRFGFAFAVSATLWLAVLIVWLQGFVAPVRGLMPILLPLAAVSVVLPPLFPGAAITPSHDSAALRIHLLVAMVAYSLLTLAALQGLLMASCDRHLHSPVPATGALPERLLASMPPLMAMERLLFQLIGAGFVLLTGTVLSGIWFSEQLFGRAFRFEHKTVFAIAAWLVFGGLLFGRRAFGWRGRVAVRWTLGGFVMLLLAYVGTRFVLEVILHRY
jgi:ABC-type uncharacterized transport system permease subunit